MKTFNEFINEGREELKRAYLKGSVKMEDIEKALKNQKTGTLVKLTVHNPKSRSKQGIVTLLDIKKGDLLTTPLATSSEKASVFKLEDVISFDTYKA